MADVGIPSGPGFGTRPGNGYSEAPTGELVRSLVEEGRRLVREEAHLARVELKKQAQAVGRGAGVSAAGGVLVHAAVLCLVGCLVAALSLAMKVWVAALIVGCVVGLVGYVMAKAGAKRITHVEPPRQTIETIKEDGRWASGTMRAVRSRMRADA
jgi:hypothetical protein